MKFRSLLFVVVTGIVYFNIIYVFGSKVEKVSPHAIIHRNSFSFPKIDFNYKRVRLDKRTTDSLRYLAELLDRNHEIIIQIDGHASQNEGSNKEKIFLSKKRCEACLIYLISQGIDPLRFKIKAWGDGLPVQGTDNNDLAKMTKQEKEAVYAANRRVEFRIINSALISYK